MKKLGLIINPIAGMGGSVGLKGTDNVLSEAIQRGASPQAAEKVKRAFEPLLSLKDDIKLITCGASMGEDVLKETGLDYTLVYKPGSQDTTAGDTIAAARIMTDMDPDILIFAGGDGTARNIYDAVGESIPVLGVPAGVKIHSPVYARSPEKAGELMSLFIRGQITKTREAEVIDINEEDYRRDIISTRLYGYLEIPYERRFMQGGKAPSPQSEKAQQMSIAGDLVESMMADTYYLVGPGSTTRALMEFLGIENTLLGVDVVVNKQIIAKDVSEQEIIDFIAELPAKLIITPTGGQGYLLGRGNQQISPAVIKKLGKKNIIVAATNDKLAGLSGEPLLVDTGDRMTDEVLKGYIRIVTGYHDSVMYRVE